MTNSKESPFITSGFKTVSCEKKNLDDFGGAFLAISVDAIVPNLY